VERITQRGAARFVPYAKYNWNWQAEEDDVGGTCGTNGGKVERVKLLVGKPEGKTPIGRPRCRWVDNNEMDLLEIGWSGCIIGSFSSSIFS
jgi:hypothetical protein